MIGLGFGVFAAGFSVAAYGWSQLRGCNAGFVSLIWPGSYKGCNGDSGGATADPAHSAAVTPSSGSNGSFTLPQATQYEQQLKKQYPGQIFSIIKGAGKSAYSVVSAAA